MSHAVSYTSINKEIASLINSLPCKLSKLLIISDSTTTISLCMCGVTQQIMYISETITYVYSVTYYFTSINH